jgi:hypothetical protein
MARFDRFSRFRRPGSFDSKLPIVRWAVPRAVLAKCGRLSVGTSELSGSASLVGAAMC